MPYHCKQRNNRRASITFSMSILAMDIVDQSKDETVDIFRGNNNEHDVLNTQLAVINKVIGVLRGGALYTTKYQLDGDPSCEPFYDRFENSGSRVCLYV